MFTPPYSPHEAWKPITAFEWNAGAARHLLSRMGFSATPEMIEATMRRGLSRTVRDLFRPIHEPERLQGIISDYVEQRERIQALINATEDREERERLQRERRQYNQQAFESFAVEWMAFAGQPENGPQEKLLLLLQNVFVVGRDKVYDTQHLMEHQAVLRRGIASQLPDLCKAISRSPAMIRYLDLDRSRAGAPNENFARELMELFTLGEGNYTEMDVREAARSFTGYRIGPDGNFRLVERDYDDGMKTLFGRTARFRGDEVIDWIFQQPASERYFVRQFLLSYMSAELPPEPYIAALGDRWRYLGFSIPELVRTVLQSRIFYEPVYRGTIIKSPTHYYLGLCQELRLHSTPVARQLLGQLRGMGQDFQNPPNVRGWQENQAWISASTVSARRALVDALFRVIDSERLNADDSMALQQAEKRGWGPFVVTRERLLQIAEVESMPLAEHLARYFLNIQPSAEYIETLAGLLQADELGNPYQRLRSAVVALLQSPQYQLA
jgi:uncharacterized protein (DUF1800 family)